MYKYPKPTKSYQSEGNGDLLICENSTKEIYWLLPRVMAPTASATLSSRVMMIGAPRPF